MIALAFVYVGLAVMVGVTLAAHRARFIARAVVCVAAPALAFAVYFAAQPPTGWPAAASPPKQAQFQWAVVREPDQLSGDRGEIDLWLTPPNSMTPRAYRLPYSRQMHRQLMAAMGAVKQGKPVAVRMVRRKRGERGPRVQPQFYRLPPPQLPSKGQTG